MPQAPNSGDWLALLGLTAMWGSAFLLTELALAAFSPTIIVAARIIIAASFLYLVMRSRGMRLPREPRAWLPMAAVAVFGNVLPFNLVSWGQQHISSSLAGVLMAMMPLFVLTLAHFLLPGGRLTASRIAGFVLGFIGVALVIGPEALAGFDGNFALWGALAALGAAFSYALSTIIARRSPVAEPLMLAVGMLFIGSLLSLPTALLDGNGAAATPSVLSVCAVAILGLLSTGYATVLYYRVVQGPGPAFLSLVNYLVPAWAVLAGAIFLGETLPAIAYVGMTLILSGIALSELGARLGRSVATVETNLDGHLIKEEP